MWDHSDVHVDMLGRLRRTARFIATTTYAQRDSALQAIAKVKAIHDQVSGILPDGGGGYRADRSVASRLGARRRRNEFPRWLAALRASRR